MEEIELIGSTSKFYQTFKDFVGSKQELDEGVSTNIRESDFRKLLSIKCNSHSFIREVSPYFAHTVKKPQRVEVDMDDFYLANDLFTNTDYVCFKNLMMIDIDCYKGIGDTTDVYTILPHCQCQIEAVIAAQKSASPGEAGDASSSTGGNRKPTWMNYKCRNKKRGKREPSCTYRYRVFKSRGGYHAFIVSHEMDKNSDIALQLMIEAGADFFYIIYSYLRHWCVRLNRKKDEAVGPQGMYPLLGDVVKGRQLQSGNNSVRTISRLDGLVKLHITFTGMAKDFPPVMSR